MNLWGIVDDEGRMELRPDLIAGAIYPGDPTMTPDVIESHLLELDESGFLTIYQAGGTSWLQVTTPLKTPRPMPSESPAPPAAPEPSGSLMAVGGAREWASERMRAEAGERSSAWAAWEAEQERVTRPPTRPLLLDAPPIGCPDHPNGRFEDCGPCGTARRRHDHWVQQQRYAEQLETYAERSGMPE